MEETVQNGFIRNTDGTFTKGTAPGPGRPADTPERVVEKKAIKQIVEEYKAKLADSLDRIEPILVAKALDADVSAIKEIHDRVMGKAAQPISGVDGQPIMVQITKYVDNLPPVQSATLPDSAA